MGQQGLYRFPWSKSDNAGAWVEVTDECTLSCPGCYRHKIEGHRPLEAVQQDILECREKTNCDGMAIAGGEPLIYPHILDVVEFIARLNVKPIILSNGEKLDPGLARDLKRAGLAKIHLHIDSAQKRPGWEGKNEAELNELRQHYADLLSKTKGVQCGYHVTVFQESLPYLPDVLDWAKKNIRKVQHISFIAFRSLPSAEEVRYFVHGQAIDPQSLVFSSPGHQETALTTEDMWRVIGSRHRDFEPAAFLNGSARADTLKYLIAVYVGSQSRIYGVLGPKTVELVQGFHHLFKGRYLSFLRSPAVGKRLFLLAPLDPQVRRAGRAFAAACLRNPVQLLRKVYSQSVHLHQPNEVLEGKVNLCDSCLNMMVYRGRLINSCRLDEYRVFGGPLTPQRIEAGTVQYRKDAGHAY